jgi:hypothetical protein
MTTEQSFKISKEKKLAPIFFSPEKQVFSHGQRLTING